MKLKMHHILLLICFVFVSGMFLTTLIKDSLKDNQRLKSELTPLELQEKVQQDAFAYAKNLNPDVDLAAITNVDIFFFKNKRELEILLSDSQKSFLMKSFFKNLSSGYGLREKLAEVTPSEGIYFVKQPGFVKSYGYFVKVDYPPESYKKYQKIDYENLKKESYVIAEKAIGDSFIQADADFMIFFIYLITKLPKEKLRLLIYPDRPPLSMEIGGTEFTSEIYKKLDIEYKKLNLIYESLKSIN
jgi:hypothetical protein